MALPIATIDHVAVTTNDVARFIDFYRSVLEATVEAEYQHDGAVSVTTLSVGAAMMNVHRAGHGHWLVAEQPTPGAVDICFRWNAPIADAVDVLHRAGVPIIEGPSPRLGASRGPATSVYFRDPDGNLVELLTTVPDR